MYQPSSPVFDCKTHSCIKHYGQLIVMSHKTNDACSVCFLYFLHEPFHIRTQCSYQVIFFLQYEYWGSVQCHSLKRFESYHAQHVWLPLHLPLAFTSTGLPPLTFHFSFIKRRNVSGDNSNMGIYSHQCPWIILPCWRYKRDSGHNWIKKKVWKPHIVILYMSWICWNFLKCQILLAQGLLSNLI